MILLTRLQGLSQSSPPRISQTDLVPALYTGLSDGSGSTPVLGTGAELTRVIDVVGDCFCINQVSEQLASAAWINTDVEVEFSVANQLKPPATIRITHGHIDWHSLRTTMLALMLGLPIGNHAEHVVSLC